MFWSEMKVGTMTYRKIGGLHHWRIGRLGGSFYIKRAVVRSQWSIAIHEGAGEIAATTLVIAALFALV